MVLLVPLLCALNFWLYTPCLTVLAFVAYEILSENKVICDISQVNRI